MTHGLNAGAGQRRMTGLPGKPHGHRLGQGEALVRGKVEPLHASKTPSATPADAFRLAGWLPL